MKNEINTVGYVYLIVFVSLIMVLTGSIYMSSCFRLSKNKEQKGFVIHPIGEIRKTEKHTRITIFKEFEPGLEGLESFGELTVVYWFDRNDVPEKRSILQVHPQGNPENPVRGVFATHSPVRPNLIAISRCKILSIDENVIEIDEIDAYDRTPVIDLKN
jgi:tRNA-Thr(GGU) m(6)t(6)A37 methyltransferase TsaA